MLEDTFGGYETLVNTYQDITAASRNGKLKEERGNTVLFSWKNFNFKFIDFENICK